MASTTSVNALSEQLVQSLVSDKTSPSKVRKHLDQFTRTVRHHNYARTNQFEVQERLNGLEEKFQVLNRADLSDALHNCRVELLLNEDRWTPDILDLLLHLSHRPLKYTRLEDLSDQIEKRHVPATVKWSDLEGHDPIDRRDRIWKQPDYGGLSSDDEDGLDSSTNSSPSSQKSSNLVGSKTADPNLVPASFKSTPNPQLLAQFDKNLFWKAQDDGRLTESQVTREILFMVQGLPTTVFRTENGRIHCNSIFSLHHLSSDSLNTTLTTAFEIATAVRTMKWWKNPHPNIPFMQVLEDSLKGTLTDFYGVVSNLESHHLRIRQEGGVVSLLKTVEDLREAAHPLLAVQSFVRDAHNHDAIGYIDLLLNTVCEAEHVSGSETFSALTMAFRDTCVKYAQHLDEWIQRGAISKTPRQFFVQRAVDQNDKARFWASWYTYSESGPDRAPEFLKPFIKSIFRCGKTVAFTKLLTNDVPPPRNNLSLASIIRAVTSTNRYNLAPLAASLSASVDQYVTFQLQTITSTLQTVLRTKYHLSSTITALSNLYLASSPLATDIIDTQLFSTVDRCLASWNDRFLISSLLSETHPPSSLETDRVIVHAEPTPASTLPTARRSADVLANIAFDYILPWPIANILLPETLASYRRVSLLQMQIRRAKWSLERRAYLRLRTLSHPRSPSTSVLPSLLLRKIRALYTTLYIFTTTIYSHLTLCVISPLTAQLHASLSPSPASPSSFSNATSTSTSTTMTIDDLITHHALYLRNLEFSSLTTKPLKLLRDTLIAILDLCVEYSFIVAEISSSTKPEVTHTLANAQLVGDANGAPKGSIDPALDEKVESLKSRFYKNLTFFIAGLRGVARSSASSDNTGKGTSDSSGGGFDAEGRMRESWWGRWERGEMMELLADSLESALVGGGGGSSSRSVGRLRG